MPQRAIRTRLLRGTALIVVVACAVIAAVASQTYAAAGAIDREIAAAERLHEGFEDMALALLEQHDALDQYRLVQSSETLASYRASGARQAAAAFEVIQAGGGDPDVAAAHAAAEKAIADWRSGTADPTIALLIVTGSAPIESVAARRLYTRALIATNQLDELLSSRQAIYRERIQAMAFTIVATLGVGGLAGLLMIVGVGVWLVRSISNPLSKLIATAERVRLGESIPFETSRHDEIGLLGRTLEQLRHSLEERFEETRRDGANALTFNRLSELMTFAASEQELIDAAVVTLHRLVPSSRGELAMLNPSLNRLVIASAWGDVGPERSAMVDIDRPDLCPGIRRGSVYAASDLSDPMVLRCPAHPATAGSVLCVPLLATGQAVGVVHLERSQPFAFDADSQGLALRVAEQVALALANARLMRTMEGLAMTDSLTQLHNARFFDPFVERQLSLAGRDGTPLAVLMIDIDNFKQFNDTHGHPAGDEALKAFAAAIVGAVRESDTVARYGGEEFVVALPGTDNAGAMHAAEKIRRAVESLIIEIGPGRYARVTASIGVTSTSKTGHDRMGLMRAADQALYRAKRNGRNRVETPDGETAAAPVGRERRRSSASPARGRRIRRDAADLTVVPGAELNPGA